MLHNGCLNMEKEKMNSKSRIIPACVVSLMVCLLLSLTACGQVSPADSSGNGAGALTMAGGKNRSDAYDQPEPATREFFAMDTYMTITAYGDGAETALDYARAEIADIENMVSTELSDSEIAVLNANGHGELSPAARYLLERSLEIYDSTDGLFDITIYPAMKAWGFPGKDFRVPEDQELATIKDRMGCDHILMGEEITFDQEGIEIDLGGIAKGYASDRVMEIFRQHGIKHGIISLGGNVAALGKKPDGSDWHVAVEDPADKEQYIGVLAISDACVITSGGYERFFLKDGITYHHILDPRDLYPAKSGLTSVTIISRDGTLADGLSTSLYIMGYEEAVAYWRSHAGQFDMILVEEDGSLSVSKGIADSFQSDRHFDIIEP